MSLNFSFGENTSNYLRMILAADPGVGKTTLLGTLTEDQRFLPSLLLDVDGNTACISRKVVYPKTQEELDSPSNTKITCLRLENYVHFESAYDYIMSSDESGKFPYKSILIDSAGVLSSISLDYIRKRHFGISKPDVPFEIQHYKPNLHLIRRIVSSLKTIPCHLIMTSQVRYPVEVKGKRSDNYCRPNFDGQLAVDIPGMCHQVGFMRVVNGKRVISFRESGQYIGKACEELENRQLAKEDIFDPTMTKLLELFLKSLK